MSMENAVYRVELEAPPWNRGEVLRYAGVGKASPDVEALLDACMRAAEPSLSYRVCYGEFCLSAGEGGLALECLKSNSLSLKKNLAGCESVVLFAATVGIEIDRLIARYAAISPTRSLLFQAIGAERIEALCDAFCCRLAEQKAVLGLRIRPRFSVGYGDFPLEAQKEIFSVLDCQRKIGLTLNESLFMSPTKSVTAMIGVEKK